MRHRKNSLITWGLIIAVLSAGMFFAGAGKSFARSATYCDDYARDYANRYANPGGDVLGGAALGALSGAPGAGAAIGGGVGALGGGATSSNDWSYVYNRAYDRCMLIDR
jgi:hypothetical protein